MNIFFPLRLFFTAVIIFTVCRVDVDAQQNLRLNKADSTTTQLRYDAQGHVIPNAPKQAGQDSLKHRDNTEDSITIHYRFFDSTTIRNLDSSINDFTKRYPLPADYVT